jgi:predicted ATPase/DNA-binding winged helix-turn-helix (wHTH) protein
VGVVYEIGPFRLDPGAGVLTQAGLPMALGARAVAVLTVLVQSPNEYVRKDRILDAAWPGVVVEENSLAAQISAIRRVLARVSGGEQWIETLARRGYRFVGPVSEIGDSGAPGVGSGRKNSNLPEPLTSFIGRERELVEIKRLLPGTRLLTLVGVGGIGKTRLALQVAAEVTDAYRDGVWFVDLGPLTDADLVSSAVAQALGVREAAGTPLLDTLRAQVKGRALLILLDNCEHLLEGCAPLADALLRSAPKLSIIATSREPLRVAGEQTYHLPTLSLPDPTASAETMSRSEAVQLFIERAAKQQLSFSLTPNRALALAQLCIHLDGIPLALELAAARTRSLSIEEINARLGDRFRLLTSGTRTALPRQQTLRATLDWSYDLLLEQERRVLRRLAVFAGGFAIEAASYVASDHTIDDFAVIDLLSQLVSRSLVVADTNDVGARYRLLETTRAYALEMLAEAEETDAIRRRHAQYFRDRFARAPDDWLRMADVEIRATYLPELDNVRAALDWAFGEAGSTAIGIALAGTSAGIWVELSLTVEGRRRLEIAVAHVESETPDLDQARLQHGLGVLCGTGALPQQLAALERAVDLYRRSGDAAGLGFALVRLGLALTTMGQFERATRVFAEASTVLESVDVPRLRAFYCSELGFLKMVTGDHAAARMNFEKAMSLYRAMGAERDALDQLGNLADVLWTLGDLDAALAGFRETVEMLRKLPMTKKSLLGGHLINLSGVHAERGELDEALAVAREGLPLFNVAGGVLWYLLEHMALRAAMAGSVVNAAHMAGFAEAAYISKKASRQPNEARAHDRLHTLLREKLAPDELECLLAEGAKLTEDQASRLALED